MQSTVLLDFYSHQGLVIVAQIGRINIEDNANSRLQVFTSDGKYLFMISDRMNYPCSVYINDIMWVYVGLINLLVSVQEHLMEYLIYIIINEFGLTVER